MKIQLCDAGFFKRFNPLTLTRPVGDLRMGILTNTQRWKLFSGESTIYYDTELYLQDKFPACADADLLIAATLIPDQKIAETILSLPQNTALIWNDNWLATRGKMVKTIEWTGEKPVYMQQRWHLYQYNHLALENDFQVMTKNRKSAVLSNTNTVIGDINQVFIEEGATVEASILNTLNGPIYIGKNAEVMEGSLIRGGFALCENAQVKMGAKIYGATTIGPECKVGGEVSNSIFQSFSNKGHDGFVGNSLIGEWCNLGADTNTSNLKNNYAPVSTYCYEQQKEIPTDTQFMGLSMGDHSKCSINTMWNTASVVGISCNIFGTDFPSKYTPSFSWGGAKNVAFRLEKALEYANNMMQRRNTELSEAEKTIFMYLYNQ